MFYGGRTATLHALTNLDNASGFKYWFWNYICNVTEITFFKDLKNILFFELLFSTERSKTL
jgi:hypothetical protein